MVWTTMVSLLVVLRTKMWRCTRKIRLMVAQRCLLLVLLLWVARGGVRHGTRGSRTSEWIRYSEFTIWSMAFGLFDCWLENK